MARGTNRAQLIGSRTNKRIFDVALTVPALFFLAPLLLSLAFLIRWQLGSPILFHQRRTGYRREPFSILKFRTMTEDKDDAAQLLPDEERLTRLGQIMRRFSLDELPELWNVLRGEMSLVGPRPLMDEYQPLYTARQLRRFEVRPGLTGWAQVNGRNKLSWEEKFRLDDWYVDHQNICLDCRILLMTLVQGLRKGGISAHGHSTMPVFRGTDPED